MSVRVVPRAQLNGHWKPPRGALRWTAGGQTPLDEPVRGRTGKTGAHGLIWENVIREHGAAPLGTIALGLVMRRSQVRVARDFSGVIVKTCG